MPSQITNLFTRYLFILSIALAGITITLMFTLPTGIISPAAPFALALIMAFTLVMHKFLIKGMDGKPNRFINRFIGATGLKLLSYLIIITLYALLNKPDAVPFIVIFLIYYICFSILEITQLLKALKRNSNP